MRVVGKQEAPAFERRDENSDFSERLWEKPIFLENLIA